MKLDQSNQISYNSYCKLGASLNSDLVSCERRNGSQAYLTYHYIGTGIASWKQDRI